MIINVLGCNTLDKSKEKQCTFDNVVNSFNKSDSLVNIIKNQKKIKYQINSDLKYKYRLFYSNNLEEVSSYEYEFINSNIKILIYKYNENISSNINKLIQNPSLLEKGCYIVFNCQERIIKIEYEDCKSKIDLDKLKKITTSILKEEDVKKIILCDYGGPCKKVDVVN